MARNNHGGARANAGRIPNNRRTDRPRGQPVIRRFFSAQPNSSSQASSSTRASSLNNTNINRAQTSRSTTSSSSSSRNENTPNARTSSSTSTSRASNGQHRVTSNVPNYDVSEEDYETDYKRGKKIRGSVNLSSQQKAIMEDANMERAKNNFAKGIFWDHPPSLVMKSIPNLKHCWMEFFKLPVFNWFPSLILGSQWKPFCPHCKKTLKKEGMNLEPRLVFGLHQNYWLNSPQRYCCQDCRVKNNNRQENEPKIRTSFYDTSEEVLEQIGNVHPELLQAFPCHLTHINAIDKDLMNLVIHSAVKGIGPAAISETVASFHELHWQKGENEWLHCLDTKLNRQPTVGQQPIRREDIEKCPEYFTLKMGGCVPSASWLLDMFCIVVKRMRPYLDSEVIKRAISSKILSIDASYKVIKWMMKWGSKERIYNALFTGSNEFNEIPFQFFSTSDNHEELGANLESLKKLGLNPHLAFTDDPGRDASLLKKIFPNLANAGDDENDIEAVPEDLVEYNSDKEILYLHDLDKLLISLSKFRQDLEDAIKNTSLPKVRVAFDAGKKNLFL